MRAMISIFRLFPQSAPRFVSGQHSGHLIGYHFNLPCKVRRTIQKNFGRLPSRKEVSRAGRFYLFFTCHFSHIARRLPNL
jgi:hypothetical protein